MCNLCCVTLQKSEDLIYAAAEAWNYAYSVYCLRLPRSLFVSPTDGDVNRELNPIIILKLALQTVLH